MLMYIRNRSMHKDTTYLTILGIAPTSLCAQAQRPYVANNLFSLRPFFP